MNGINTDYAGNYIYESNQLQFFNTPEGYAEPIDVTNYNAGFRYTYQYKDHMEGRALRKGPADLFSERASLPPGQISYTDTNQNTGAISLSIVEENNYYPFGLQHQGYNSNISSNGNSTAQKWKYNGVELEESLGLNLYEMDVRSYDPAIGRFTSIDPVIHYEFSTYNAFDNNPIVFADPSGANADWIPLVNEDGTVSYIAEEGDSAETLQEQYDLEDGQAEEIIGDQEVVAGQTTISGVDVQEVTGSSVLQLDLNSDMATGDRVIQQFVFANDFTSSQGKNGWYATEFYGGVFNQLQTTQLYNGNIQLNGESVEAQLSMQWYTSQGTPYKTFGKDRETFHSVYISTADMYQEDRNGRFSGKHQELSYMRFPRGFAVYNPPKFRTDDGLIFAVKRNQKSNLLKHFKKR